MMKTVQDTKCIFNHVRKKFLMLETTISISNMLFPYGTFVSQERLPRMLELMGAYFLTQDL